MKKIPYFASAVIVMTLLANISAYADGDHHEASQTISQHEALAAQYEAKAAEQDALIAEHSPMKKEYEERFWMLKKAAKPQDVVDMEKHCNTIINAAQNEKSALLEFAKWHRMRAAELKGM